MSKKQKSEKYLTFTLYHLSPKYFYIQIGKMYFKLVKRKNWILSERPRASDEEELYLKKLIPYTLDQLAAPEIIVRAKSDLYNLEDNIKRKQVLLEIGKLLTFKTYLEEKKEFKMLEVILRPYNTVAFFIDYENLPDIDATSENSFITITKKLC